MKSEDVKVYEAWIDIDDNLKMTNDYSDDEYLQLVTKSDFDALSLKLAESEAKVRSLEDENEKGKNIMRKLLIDTITLDEHYESLSKVEKTFKKKITELEQQLKKAEEVIKFYGNEMNYSVDDYHGISGEMRKRCVLYKDCEERNDVYSYAGKLARQYLKSRGEK